MINFRRINYVKFVSSLFLIVFFIFVIVYADKFSKGEEPLAIDSSFIEGDGGISHEINVDAITINIDNQDNGVIQYVVQQGDNLFKIASTFGTTVSAIKKSNNLQWEATLGQTLKIANNDDGIIYTIPEKTNIVVFANKYNLNIQDLMTLNYLQDETDLLSPWQEIFINISKEKAYELALLEKPKPVVIPASTITYKPTINKPSAKPAIAGTKKPSTSPGREVVVNNDASWTKGKIISKWTYTKDITNGFARGQCTWYAAIVSPNIFPYTDDNTQERPFNGNAGTRCAGAKKAWLRVWSKPAAGAIIVYSQLRSSAGHVGKVISYSAEDNEMIIRDMNYAGKFIVTERYEDPDNSKISCYIYGK